MQWSTKKVIVAFLIGKYSDEVLCDVEPIHVDHLLLNRPWQFDRCVIYDGYKNRHSLTLKGQNYTLAPSLPREMYADQIKIMKSLDGQSGSEASSSKRT